LSIDSLFPGRSVCNATQLPIPAQNGLIGYWPFCGNANDASINSNNGLASGPILTTDRFNIPNSAYYFDGINDRIEIPHNSNYSSGRLSLSLWFKADSYTAALGYGPHLVSKREATGWGTGFQTNIGIWLNQYACWADWGPGGTTNDHIIYNSTSPIGLSLNNWFNFVYTHDVDTVKLYLNGILVKTGISPGLLLPNSIPVWIGARPKAGSNSSWYTGKIDDVYLWNRVLSATEVSALYSRAPLVSWSTGATTNTIVVSPIQTTTYYVTVTDGITTCTDSVKVSISAVDTSIIPLDPTSICPTGGSVRLQAGVGSSYQWLKDNIVVPGANARVYTATQIGSYRVVITNTIGCVDTSRSIQVIAYPQPIPGFTVNNLTQCLSGNSFVFTNTSTITPGTLSYSWNFGNGTTSTATNPTVSYAAAGTYTVTLIATSNSGCIDSVRQNVAVNSNASGSISTPTSTIICEGGSVTLSANGGTTYQWALNGANIPGATNPTYSASLPGVYSVQINNASGCSGTSSNTITLSLVRRPTADFTSTGSCASFPVTFTNQSTVSNSGIVTYSWTFGNGSSSTNVNPTAVYSSPGNYNITLVVTPQACPALSSSITKPITVISATANQRYTSLNAVVNRNLQLQARTFTGASYQWIPPSGLNNATIVNPIFNSNRQQEYLIKISTPDGCVITDTLLVRIFDGRGIYLPKGFTPNGDGNNDKLTPRLVGISRLLFFKVYDRWGQLMYQTGIAGEGWDGTFKGVKQPIETYTWVAEGIDIDANTIRETGNSMLLR
jgi:gliding motility-associated-like protein